MHRPTPGRTLRTRTDRELAWSTLPDAHAAAELMRASWSENRESPLDYDADVLRSYLEYPGDGPVLAPALLDDGRLVAFVVGMPRTVSLHGEPRRLLLMTFFTVAPGWKGHGLGAEVWAECLRRARDAGYDGAVHYCVDGNVSNHVTLAGARRLGLSSTHLGTVCYLMRLLTPVAGGPRAARPPVVDDFLQAARTAAGHAAFARRWTAAEAAWQCHGRLEPIGVTCRQGDAAGAIAGYGMRMLDSLRTRCAFVDDVLLHELAPPDRVHLVEEFVAAAAAHARIAVVPVLDYADMSAFHATGFRRSPRTLNAYLTMWDAVADVDVRSMYMDVL